MVRDGEPECSGAQGGDREVYEIGHWSLRLATGVSKNRGGPPKSSILIRFSIINYKPSILG